MILFPLLSLETVSVTIILKHFRILTLAKQNKLVTLEKRLKTWGNN